MKWKSKARKAEKSIVYYSITNYLHTVNGMEFHWHTDIHLTSDCNKRTQPQQVGSARLKILWSRMPRYWGAYVKKKNIHEMLNLYTQASHVWSALCHSCFLHLYHWQEIAWLLVPDGLTGQSTLIWTRSGNQGDRWLRAQTTTFLDPGPLEFVQVRNAV